GKRKGSRGIKFDAMRECVVINGLEISSPGGSAVCATEHYRQNLF
ncbi:19132_t:CDS:1, partial [Rhizophagus irregularis]